MAQDWKILSEKPHNNCHPLSFKVRLIQFQPASGDSPILWYCPYSSLLPVDNQVIPPLTEAVISEMYFLFLKLGARKSLEKTFHLALSWVCWVGSTQKWAVVCCRETMSGRSNSLDLQPLNMAWCVSGAHENQWKEVKVTVTTSSVGASYCKYQMLSRKKDLNLKESEIMAVKRAINLHKSNCNHTEKYSHYTFSGIQIPVIWKESLVGQAFVCTE